MNPQILSEKYTVRKLCKEDIPSVLEVCRGNSQYYRFCPPAPSYESIEEDMHALAPGKSAQDKYYIGYFENAVLTAVMDLIMDFPEKDSAFLGFFMMQKAYQNAGHGSAVIQELCEALSVLRIKKIRLAWIKGNAQAEHFWRKNGFVPTGETCDQNGHPVIQAERIL